MWRVKKKLEDVSLQGPFARPDLRKKKKKKAEVSFTFEESTEEWREFIEANKKDFLQFQKSSSFVGRVVWSAITNEMSIELSGKSYGFCSVPRDIYDRFRDAGSKGKFFNEFIKGSWDC